MVLVGRSVMDSRDRPTDEEVAAACKEGHPVTKVTAMILITSEGSTGFAGATEADASGPQLWECRHGGMKAQNKDLSRFKIL